MTLTLSRAAENDLSAMHAILSICGEHMHRTQRLSHWYPFRDFSKYASEVETADVYAIYDDAHLIGTFYVTPKMRTWYADVQWHDAAHEALYLGGLGILPMAQGRGVGRWAMEQIDALAIAHDYDALRFDGVASNASLLAFYDGLGYHQRGLLTSPRSQVMVYERLFVHPNQISTED